MLPPARSLAAYSLRNHEELMYVQDVALRTGGYGLALALLLALLLLSFLCGVRAHCDGRFFTAGRLGPLVLARWRRHRQLWTARRQSRRTARETAADSELDLDLAATGGGGGGGGSASAPSGKSPLAPAAASSLRMASEDASIGARGAAARGVAASGASTRGRADDGDRGAAVPSWTWRCPRRHRWPTHCRTG